MKFKKIILDSIIIFLLVTLTLKLNLNRTAEYFVTVIEITAVLLLTGHFLRKKS